MVGEGGVVGKSYWGMGARECDACRVAAALVYCRADGAYLCGGCDGRIHGGANSRLRHERVWLCEVCEQAPAAVTCKADAAALCTACDADIHSANPLARRHDRIPVVPFLDSPSAAAAAVKNSAAAVAGDLLVLKPSDDDEEPEEEDRETEAAQWMLPNTKAVVVETAAPEMKPADYFFCSPEVDPYLDLDYASSMDARYQHQTDSVVPVQAKTVAAVHPPPFVGADGYIDFDFARSKPSYGGSHSTAPSLSHSQMSSSEVGVVPDGSAMADISNPYGGRSATTAMDREARVMRYREKRKNRRFEKTIRYASRKAYAETRPRIKGRFAKRTEIEEEEPEEIIAGDDNHHRRIYSSAAAVAAAFMVDPGYGLVPSF